MKRLVVTLVCWAIQQSAMGAVWGEYYVGGTSCNYETLRPVQAGGRLYVDFEAFGISMPEGERGDGLTVRRTCTLRVILTPPEGMRLAGFSQVYRGGLIKSTGSSAQLAIRYNVGTELGRPLAVVFGEGEEILPGDDGASFSRRYLNSLAGDGCGETMTYGLNMTLTASRRHYGEFFIGGLDQMESRLLVVPEFVPCLDVVTR